MSGTLSSKGWKKNQSKICFPQFQNQFKFQDNVAVLFLLYLSIKLLIFLRFTFAKCDLFVCVLIANDIDKHEALWNKEFWNFSILKHFWPKFSPYNKCKPPTLRVIFQHYSSTSISISHLVFLIHTQNSMLGTGREGWVQKTENSK